MAWGGKGGQVDRIQKTKKGTVQRAVEANKESDEKKAWLKKTRNSPAAKAWGNSKEADDRRWALQQKHRASQAARKKKKTTPKPAPKKNIEELKKNTASSSGRGSGRAAFQKTPNTYGKTPTKKKRKSAFADTSQWD
tara:strand:+ start:42 stop:452 length:411 start_codon:yes stop_codon:yes gene_type:complete